MADERVTILGVLEDQISGPMSKVATSATSVEKSVAGADQATLKFVARTSQLTQRIVSLQLALQTAGAAAESGAFGKFSGAVDVGSKALGAFGSIVTAFPNKFGLFVGGLAAGATVISGVTREIDELKRKSDALAAGLEKNAQRAAKAQGGRLFRELTGGPGDQIRMDITEQSLQGEAAMTRRLEAERRVTQLQKSLVNEIMDTQRQIDNLRAIGPGFGGDAHVVLIAQLERKLADLNKRDIERIKNLKETNEQIETENGRIKEQAERIAELNGQLDQLEAKKAFEDKRASLDAAGAQLTARLERGEITALDFLSQKAKHAGDMIDFLVDNLEHFASRDEGVKQVQEYTKAFIEMGAAARFIEEFQKNGAWAFFPGNGQTNTRIVEQASQTADVLKGIAQGIGQAFAAATDPLIDGLINGTLKWREFAQQFLLQIAKMIAQALVLQAIMAGLGAVGLGFNTGGPVLGFATGGPIPGPNVNADIVDAKLTPGEFVIRKGAVDYYGAQMMAALNAKAFPRVALPDVTGMAPMRIGHHFAEGGEVGPGGSQATGPIPAVLVADNQSMERLLKGGTPTLLQWMQENKGSIKGMLG